jgi:fumarate reductase (CoM/CoB) subunit A
LEYSKIQSDVLVIGGGGAGVRAAIEADSLGVSVALVSKGVISRCGLTPMAGYSYQAAFGHANAADNPRVHFEDTVREGRRLGDENLILCLTEEARERALEMEKYGVRFTKDGDRFAQVRHPGQTYPRINRIPGRGYQMMLGLKKELIRRQNVQVFEDCLVSRVLTESSGRPAGAVAFLQRQGRFVIFQSKAIVLATGGYEELWEKTDTAPDSTGDGTAMAFELGAQLVDLEMMLYYPIVTLGSKIFPSMRQVLQYESLLEKEYLGGTLRNARGEEFLPSGKLPVRDVLMKLIFTEKEEGRATDRGGVFIDLTNLPLPPEEIEKRIDQIGARLQFDRIKYLGQDLTRDCIEVAPACHYSLGGVRINERTETSVSGLFSAGEVSGNIHGANRISGNALAETQVFGRRAGESASREAKRLAAFPSLSSKEIEEEIQRVESFFTPRKDAVRPREMKKRLQRMMEQNAALKRDAAGLGEVIESMTALRQELPRIQIPAVRIFNYEMQEALEVSFMVQVAELVARAALCRTESRGHHYRSDYPQEDPAWLKHTLIQKRGESVECGTTPVIRVNE